MSGAEVDKMSRPRGRRELTTIQAVKQLNIGQSRLPDWTREISAKLNSYQSGCLCVGGRVNQATTRMWSLINQTATKIWGGDPREPVSSLVLAVVGADEQNDYLCPWSILRNEGDGRSWAINNTSNLSEVEINKASEYKHKNRKEAVYIM
jgi:hypothetical protein